MRCRRESKRCEFSATRRKRKMADDADSKDPPSVLHRDKRMMSADGGAAAALDSTTDNTTKSNGVTSYPRPAVPSYDSESRTSTHSQWGDSPAAAAPHRMSIASSQPYIPAPTSVPSDQYPRHRASFSGVGRPSLLPHGIDSGQHMMNKTAAELLSPAISNTHDALHLLSEAAGRTEDLNRQQLELQLSQRQASTSTFTSSASPMMGQANNTPGKASRSNSSTQQGVSRAWYPRSKGSATADPIIDGQEAVDSPKVLDDVEYTNARRAWSRLRFVRAGWFTVDEAMAYIS